MGFVCVRSSDEAIAYVHDYGCPDFISFDHDLGEDDTSMRFINWFIDEVLDGRLQIPDDFSYAVHSGNPVGAENIRNRMDGFLKFLKENPR